MLCVLILCVLQSLRERTAHASRVTYYWQTVDPTDQVVDYWNHGPDLQKAIEEKKFQVFTLTTKRPDIFPPWLTRGTTESTITLLPSRVFLRTRAMPKKTATETTADVLRQQEAESTDPFSVFLRKLFKVLTRKPLLELQMLVGPFVRFMTVEANIVRKPADISEAVQRLTCSSRTGQALKLYLPSNPSQERKLVPRLLENRFLNWFGKNVTDYLGETLKNIERISPTMLHVKCKLAYKALSTRSTAFDGKMNELLDLVDDMFDAAEEETMQDVLQHVSQYPNTSKSAEALVHDLIDAVVFKPVIRVNGTLKGDHLLKLLSDVVSNRKINSRRNIYDIDVYDLVRLNIENIRKNVNKMNDSSSSEGSEKVKILRSQIKTTKIVKNKGLETKHFIKNLMNNLEQLQIIIEKLEIPSASNEYEIDYSDRSEGDLLNRNKRKTVQPNVFHFKPSNEHILMKKKLRVHKHYSEKYNVGFETTTDYIRQHSKHKSTDRPKKVSLSKHIFDTIKRDVSILKMRRPITQPVIRIITYPSPNALKIESITAKPSNEFGSYNTFKIDSELHVGKKEMLREQHSVPGGAEIHTTEAVHSSRYIGDQSQDKQDSVSNTTRPQKALNINITKRQNRKQVKIVPSDLENKTRDSETLHGETHHIRKKKYHRLKRKYERLKEITNMILRSRDSNEELDAEASGGLFDKKAEEIDLNAKIAKIDELRDTLVKNFKELLKVSKGVKENFPESTTVKRKRRLKINTLLDDEQNITNQNDVFNLKNKADDVLSGKTTSQSEVAGYVSTYTYSTTEFSRKKIELKNNIFKSLRRSNDAAPVIQAHSSQSQETDLEPVLKSNIYKAVKETLKNSTLKPL